MIPLKDNVSSRGFPLVNLALIGSNIYVFFIELHLGRALEKFIRHYGLIPAAWAHMHWGARALAGDAPATLVTSMFLHGGWMHIVSNMWCLYLFGNSVEGALGHFRYGLLYFMTGIIAAVVQLATHWGSSIPTIGASGAIAGVMGAYFLLFPRAKIKTLIPIFFLPAVVEISAFVFLILWFWSQIYSGLFALGAEFGGIAWWAHIGGFLAGVYWVRRL